MGFSWRQSPLCVHFARIQLIIKGKYSTNYKPTTIYTEASKFSDTFIYQNRDVWLPGCRCGLECWSSWWWRLRLLLPICFLSSELCYSNVERDYLHLKLYGVWEGAEISPIFLPGRICLGAMQIDRFNSGTRKLLLCDGCRRTIQETLCRNLTVS